MRIWCQVRKRFELACSRSTGNEETTYMPVQQVITGHAGKLTQ